MSGETLDAIGIREILAALPHRYPFLLVDRIIDIRGDEHGIGIKNVTTNEPHFVGHFPDNPVMPGVLVLEGMAQTAGTLCIRSLPSGQRSRRWSISSPSTRPSSASRSCPATGSNTTWTASSGARTCGGFAARPRSTASSSPRPSSAP